jgi:hypothetical protein
VNRFDPEMTKATALTAQQPARTKMEELRAVSNASTVDRRLLRRNKVNEAIRNFENDELLKAARVLLLLRTEEEEEEEEKEEEEEEDDDDDEEEERCKYILEKAEQSERFIKMLSKNVGRCDEDVDAGWIEQRQLPNITFSSHSYQSQARTKIYYKTEENATKLTIRVDQSIEREMLVPVLATLNESELYISWLPSWTVPRLKFSRTEKIDQRGRCSQLLLVTVECPWPFSTREVVLDALAFDDIDESGIVAVLLNSAEFGEDPRVPEIDQQNITRIGFHGGFLFRAIPSESEEWKKAREEHNDEIIVSFIFDINPKISYVPVTILNFITRNAIGTIWSMFMKVAMKVKNGELEEHKEAIKSKRELLYDWVDERVHSMFQRIF